MRVLVKAAQTVLPIQIAQVVQVQTQVPLVLKRIKKCKIYQNSQVKKMGKSQRRAKQPVKEIYERQKCCLIVSTMIFPC